MQLPTISQNLLAKDGTSSIRLVATSGGAQMRGFATGVGSNADIGAGPGRPAGRAGNRTMAIFSTAVEWLFGYYSLPWPLSQTLRAS